MNQKAYVINAIWGEYDDYTRIPMFVCPMKMEVELFVEAFNNREPPYWNKVEDYFMREYGYVPHDIGFSWDEIDILTLIQHHPNT
jgi:hypothetical protein